MQQINVNELIGHPQNEYYFDEVEGVKWKEFLESVKTSGIIEPIVITQDKVVVSGNQRVRACKELGIESIMCEIRIYDNDDKVIKDLIETNIRQRGTIDGSAVKQGRRYMELERIYGIRKGSAGGDGSNQYSKELEPNNSDEAKISQSDLAKANGVSVDTWNNYKKLTTLIPELVDLVDTGIVTPTTASTMLFRLSQEEQQNLVQSLDVTKKITQKEVQKYIDKIKQLESIPPKMIEKEIDNTDYTLSEKNKNLLLDINKLKTENSHLLSMNRTLEESKKVTETISNTYKKQSEEYMNVKSKIIDMGLEPDCDYSLYGAASEIAKLSKEIEELLLNKLAPIKYQSFMIVIQNSDILKKNFMNILNMVNEWHGSMVNFVDINKKYEFKNNIIDMEEKENENI